MPISAYYYKHPISKELVKELATKNVDIERFQRDVDRLKRISDTKGKNFTLTKEIINELVTQQAKFMSQGQQHFIRNDETRAANERAAKIREEAAQARQKAKSYSGKLEEKTKSEQEKALSMLRETLDQSTLGMTPLHYGLKTGNDIIARLEEHTKGRSYAQGLVKSIASEFTKQEEKALAEEISILEYAKKCQEILEAHAPELNKPQTFFEAARDFFFNSLRTILNAFDKLYTWVMSKNKTFAEEAGRKSYIPAPKTALATELEAIQSEFPRFEKELTQQLETTAANDKKYDFRQQNIAAAKSNKHPEKREIEAKQFTFIKTKLDLARTRKTELANAKREKADLLQFRREQRRAKMVDLVQDIVRQELDARHSLVDQPTLFGSRQSSMMSETEHNESFFARQSSRN